MWLSGISLRDSFVLIVGGALMGEFVRWFGREVLKDLVFGEISGALRPLLLKMFGPDISSFVASAFLPYLIGFGTVFFVAWWFGWRRATTYKRREMSAPLVAVIISGVVFAGCLLWLLWSNALPQLSASDTDPQVEAQEPESGPKADELNAHFGVAALIEESLIPVLKEADGIIKSVAANLEQRGAETTLGFLDELRTKAAAAFDGIAKNFDKTHRYTSLDELRKSYGVVRDRWWEGFNRVVGDIRRLPQDLNREQIEHFTGANLRGWNSANEAAYQWTQEFLSNLRTLPK